MVLENLIQQLTSPPVMAYPDFKEPFILHTDASETGLDAVLYQKQDGILRVIAYGSQTLTPAESNYHLYSGKLEFLVLRWSICDQFRDYLYHAPSFRVFTDNNPLTYVLTSAKLSATGLQWIGELVDFDFDMKYRLCKSHIDASFFSRVPLDFDAYMKACTEEVSPDAIHAIACSVQLQDDGETNWVTALTDDPSVLTSDSVPMQKPTTPQIHQLDIATAQRQDKAIGPVMAYLENGKRNTSKQTENNSSMTGRS